MAQRTAGMTAFVKADSSLWLRRALLRNHSGLTIDVAVGQRCHHWWDVRAGRLQKVLWQGPATVALKGPNSDGKVSVCWLVHGASCTLAVLSDEEAPDAASLLDESLLLFTLPIPPRQPTKPPTPSTPPRSEPECEASPMSVDVPRISCLIRLLRFAVTALLVRIHWNCPILKCLSLRSDGEHQVRGSFQILFMTAHPECPRH